VPHSCSRLGLHCRAWRAQIFVKPISVFMNMFFPPRHLRASLPAIFEHTFFHPNPRPPTRPHHRNYGAELMIYSHPPVQPVPHRGWCDILLQTLGHQSIQHRAKIFGELCWDAWCAPGPRSGRLSGAHSCVFVCLDDGVIYCCKGWGTSPSSTERRCLVSCVGMPGVRPDRARAVCRARMLVFLCA
jgi:hypothetical protein